MNKFIILMRDKYVSYLPGLIDAIVMLIIGWYGIKLLIHIIQRMMKRSQIDQIVIDFASSIIKVALRIVLFVTVISAIGVPTGSFVAVLTTAGAAVVLGLQDSMKGIVSGIVILFAKPFVKGDIIEANGYIGKIQEIQLLYTILMTFDNKMVVIPNNELASSTFVNYSHEDMRRVDMTMDVHYESDVEKAKALILQVIKEHPSALKTPLPYVRVNEYKESAITIGIRVWTKTEDYYTLRDDLLEKIKEIFDQNQITIPYNQLDIHLYNKDKS